MRVLPKWHCRWLPVFGRRLSVQRTTRRRRQKSRAEVCKWAYGVNYKFAKLHLTVRLTTLNAC